MCIDQSLKTDFNGAGFQTYGDLYQTYHAELSELESMPVEFMSTSLDAALNTSKLYEQLGQQGIPVATIGKFRDLICDAQSGILNQTLR